MCVANQLAAAFLRARPKIALATALPLGIEKFTLQFTVGALIGAPGCRHWSACDARGPPVETLVHTMSSAAVPVDVEAAKMELKRNVVASADDGDIHHSALELGAGVSHSEAHNTVTGAPMSHNIR